MRIRNNRTRFVTRGCAPVKLSVKGGPPRGITFCPRMLTLHLPGKAGLHELTIGRRSTFRGMSFAHAVAALQCQLLAAVPLSRNLGCRGDVGGNDWLALNL